MRSIKEWPVALRRQWLLTGAAGAGFLLTGLVVFIALEDRTLLMLSVLLALCILLRCLLFYRIAFERDYEIVEGVCIELGRAGLKKQRTVRLLQEDGNEYAVCLDKRLSLRIGNRYRFYFRKDTRSLSEYSTGFDCFPGVQLITVENLGEYHAADEMADESEKTQNGGGER